MKNTPARRVATTGLLFALALALSWLEGQLAGALGLVPGVKLGLANIVVMFALLYLGGGQALALVALKALFAVLTRGPTAGVLSGAGGLLSLGVMALLLKLPKKPSVLVLSVAGALAHNTGQLLVLRLWFGRALGYYAPVLAVSGIAMGVLTAVLLRALLPALRHTGLGGAALLKEDAASNTTQAAGPQGGPAGGQSNDD